MLRFARVAVFGGDTGRLDPIRDLRLREMIPFAVLLLLVLSIGVAPAPLMDKVQGIAAGVSGLAVAAAPTQGSRQAAVATSEGAHAR